MAVHGHDPGDEPPLLQLVTALTGLAVFPPLTLDHIASASLNIATALHAEATGGVSHGFGGRRVQNAKILHFVEFAEETERVATPYRGEVLGYPDRHGPLTWCPWCSPW